MAFATPTAFLRIAAFLTLFASAACQLASKEAAATDGSAASSGAEYDVVHGWPVLPPGRILGQATGVGVDSHDHVFVFHRAGREWSQPLPDDPIQATTIAVFDGETGEHLAEWGQGLFACHTG